MKVNIQCDIIGEDKWLKKKLAPAIKASIKKKQVRP